jgi:iron(III) transport system substrate-binding protein
MTQHQRWATMRADRRAFLRALTAGSVAALAACQQPTATPSGAAAPAGAAPSPAGGATNGDDWEARWNALIEGARREGELVLSGPPTPETRVKVPEAFTRRFGVPVEYNSVRSNELVVRLLAEKQAGTTSVDVTLNGLGTIADDLYPAGLLADLRPHLLLPEVTDPAVWATDSLFVDPEQQKVLRLLVQKTAVLAINRDYLDPARIRLATDLLSPEFKGKIAGDDPTVGGSGRSAAVALYVLMGEEFVRQLYGEQMATTRDPRQGSDWLARGTYPISLAPVPAETERLRQEGFPIEVVGSLPDLTGWTAGGFGLCTLVDGGPHPNAARLFVNWLASREGVETFSRSERLAGTRNDIDYAQWVPAYTIPTPGMEYLDIYNWDFKTQRQPPALEKIREIALSGRPAGAEPRP